MTRSGAFSHRRAVDKLRRSAHLPSMGRLLAVLLVTSLLLPGCRSQSDLEGDLVDAARHGKVQQVGSLLDRGVDINAREEAEDGETAVIAAASEGKAIVLDLLIARGADVNAVSSQGTTALTFAASH